MQKIKITHINMKLVSALIITSLLTSFIVGNACAQSNTNSADQQTQQQMLAQIKKLQQQQLAQQAALTNQQRQTTPLSGRLHAPLVRQMNRQATSNPSSTFEAPFDKQQIPKTQTEKNVATQAYAGAVQNLLPMAPQQIHHLRQLYTASQYAAAASAGVPPKPIIRALAVKVSPGDQPPVIRLNSDDVTMLVFLDSTGAPWPIDRYDINSSKAFSVNWNKKDNVLFIKAKQPFASGNMAVTLRTDKSSNNPPPHIPITLTAGQKQVDVRADLHVPGFGPNAKMLPIISGLPPHSSDVLLTFLNGIPPTGSKALTVTGGALQAWTYKGKLYLRTKMNLLSPGWYAQTSSADGMHTYELQKTSDLYASLNGKEMHLKLTGF